MMSQWNAMNVPKEAKDTSPLPVKETSPQPAPLLYDDILTRRAPWLVLLAVLMTVGLDLFFFNGFFASDDKDYFWAAVRVAENGKLSAYPLAGHTRLILLAWNWYVGALSKFNVQVMAASYIFWHVATLLLTCILARQLFNRRAGVIAAYTTATFPLFIIFSTGILPDLLIAAFFVLALLSFHAAFQVRRRGHVVLTLLLMLTAGVCVGLAYTAKELGLVPLPFFFFAWLLTEIRERRRTRKLIAEEQKLAVLPSAGGKLTRPISMIATLATGAFFAIGFFAIFGAEYKLLQHLTGRPDFFRLTALTGPEVDLSKHTKFLQDGGYNPANRFGAAMERLSSDFFPKVLKYLFLGGVIIYPFLPRRNWPLFFFGIWLFAFLTWGTYSFKHYYPPRIQARYYIPAFPFIIVMYSAVLAWLLGWINRVARSPYVRRFAWGVVAVVLFAFPFSWMRGPDHLAGQLYRTDLVRHLAQAISDATAQSANLIVLGDRAGQRIMPLWFRGMPGKMNGRRPPNVILADELTQISLENVFAQGHFNYVHAAQYISTTGIYAPVSGFDGLVLPILVKHPTVRQLGNPRRVPPKSVDAQFYHSVEKGGLGIAQVGPYQLTPMLVSRYQSIYKSRTAEFVHHFASLHLQDDRYFHRAKPVDMYRIAAVPAAYSMEGVQKFNGDASKSQSLRWISSNTDLAREVDHQEICNFVVKTSKSNPATITASQMGEPVPPMLLPAEKRFWITIEVKAAGTVSITGVIDVFAEAKDTILLTSMEVPLANGKNEFGLFTAEKGRYVLPSFEVSGEGEFSIGAIEIETRKKEKSPAE